MVLILVQLWALIDYQGWRRFGRPWLGFLSHVGVMDWSLIIAPVWLVLQSFLAAAFGRFSAIRFSLLIDAALVFTWCIGYAALYIVALFNYAPPWAR